MSGLAAAWLLALLLLTAVPAAHASALGFLEFHQDGSGGVNGLNGSEAVAISPDGSHIYVAGTGEDALAVFSRDAATGALTFLEAVLNQGDVEGLNQVRAVAVSPDGKHVYAAGFADKAVAVFSRDAGTGALTFVEAQKNGKGGVTTLDGAHGVTVSPDGDHVYVASAGSNSVTVFSRSQTTGGLTLVEAHVDGQNGITSLAAAETVVLSPDGDHVYVAGQDDDAITVFSRNAATGALTLVEVQQDGIDGVDGLDWVQGVTVSPDGAHVYSAGANDNSVAVFSRDAATGALTFVEHKDDGVGDVDGLSGVEWVTVSPDGGYLYAISDVEHAVVVFTREAATGMLTFAHVYNDGVGGFDGLGGAEGAVVSPDRGQVYVAASVDNAIAVLEVLCGNGAFDLEEYCDDGNAENGDCCSAICTNEPAGMVCADDGNVCTDDKCNGAGLCLHVNNTAPCDDGDYCTADDACASRVCQGRPRDCSGVTSEQCLEGVCDEAADECVAQPKSDGTACDDGDDLCTQTDTCRAGVCVGTNPVICTALDQCHGVGVCDPATGVCPDPPKPDGTACDDGDLCTQTDTCLAGVCVGSNPVICIALDQCHEAGLCDPATGVCSDPDLPDDTPCDDDNLCTQIDACEGGVCGGSDPVICTALDQCHIVGTCDPATGVCSDPIKADGTRCDDGDLCTQTDACQAGTCVGSNPVLCTALDQCHIVGTCDPATGVCSDPIKADGTRCDDGDLCTQNDTCRAGICVGSNPVLCNALDQCHDVGVCDPATGVCSEPAKTDGGPCDDADACTLADSCVAGICVGADPVVCTASDQCHDVGVCDPATGECSDPAKADGSPCDDASACTLTDGCVAGVCEGADPIVCTASDQCYDAGTCNPATGLCSDEVVKADGSACDDGDPCTQTDTCIAGVCDSGNPVVCAAADKCHDAGTCDPATGLCSGPAKADGSPCDDGSLCTRTDSCLAGVCSGSNPVICSAADQCHDTGTCDPSTGLCSGPVKVDGEPCDDGNSCTQSDTCIAGVCYGGNPVICSARNDCRDGGTCDPATGQCSSPAKADGSPCDDANACSRNDVCVAGECMGEPLPDSDADGFCDAIDLCSQIPDPAQTDADNDGIGDLCQCTAPAPGRCISGGGSKQSDCLLEVASFAPVSLNRRETKVKSVIHCSDGDARCDLDGARDGQCSFGISFCFGNADPRYPRCTPSGIQSMEVLQPEASRSSAAAEIEQALGALGLEVRRRGRIIADSIAPVGNSQCSPLVRLVTPAPKVKDRKASLKKFQIRATAISGRRDKDQFTLACE